MLTEDQLADQLRAQLRREIAAIEPRTDLLASLRRRQARRSLAMQAGLVAAPAAAAAAAVAMLVSAGGRGAAPGKSTVLTTATVQRMASESRLALAQSGRATISYRLSDNGASQGSGRDSITFWPCHSEMAPPSSLIWLHLERSRG
jgi:negative regulator of sigma E activity